jgi:hypothetical protein
MKTMNIDLGLFTATTLITGLHTLGGYGYEVSAMEAKNTVFCEISRQRILSADRRFDETTSELS